MNHRPQGYESCALPLSYIGKCAESIQKTAKVKRTRVLFLIGRCESSAYTPQIVLCCHYTLSEFFFCCFSRISCDFPPSFCYFLLSGNPTGFSVSDISVVTFSPSIVKISSRSVIEIYIWRYEIKKNEFSTNFSYQILKIYPAATRLTSL